MVVVAYGLILPQAVLDIPSHGCLNIHASLLPRWRGAAPIARAVEAGDGDDQHPRSCAWRPASTPARCCSRASLPIGENTTAASLAGGARAARRAAGGCGSRPTCRRRTAGAGASRPESATYARKLSKEEAHGSTGRSPAAVLARRVRAFNPALGGLERSRRLRTAKRITFLECGRSIRRRRPRPCQAR